MAEIKVPVVSDVLTTTQVFLPFVSEANNTSTTDSGGEAQNNQADASPTQNQSVQENGRTAENVATATPLDLGSDTFTAPALPVTEASESAANAASAVQATVASWRINASKNGASVHDLGATATLIIPAAPFIRRGINPTHLFLYTRPQEGEPWQSISSEYRADERIFVVQVTHFSDFSMAGGMKSNGHILPTLRGFSSDHNTGFALASLAIEAPAGLGGLSPGLGLSYSSGSVDDLARNAEPTLRHIQSSWAGGLGWNLNGLSYIYINHDFNAQPTLVLNGTAVTLVEHNGVWKSDPELFYYITTNGYSWSVRTPDGRHYLFATLMMLRDQTYNGTEWYDIDRPSRYYLTKATDSLGNTMEYAYEKESDCVPRGYAECGHSTTAYTDSDHNDRFCGPYQSNPISGNYDRAIYPTEIRWSGNTKRTGSTSDDDPPTLRVLFITTPRPDTWIKPIDDPCNEAQYGSKIVTEIVVQSCQQLATNETNQACSDNNPTRWHTLRRYVLNYRMNVHHSLLTSVSEYGKNGTALLRTHTFKYSSDSEFCNAACATVNQHADFLRKVDNGWGGKVTYFLSTANVDCAGSDCSGRRNERVDRLVFDNGIGQYAVTDYSYVGQPQGNNTTQYNYEFLGYVESQATTRAVTTNPNVTLPLSDPNVFTPTAEKKERWVFYTRTGPGVDDIDPRHGKTRFYGIYRANEATPNNSNAIFAQQNAVWNGSTWINDNGWNVVTLSNPTRKWVRQEWSYEFTAGIYPNGVAQAGFGNTKRFYYEEPGYGRLLRVEEYDGLQTAPGTPLRSTVTDYATNVYANGGSLYLTALPARVRLYAGAASAGDCRAETRSIYWDPDAQHYGNHNRDGNYNSVPWSPLPARIEQALSNCNDSYPSNYQAGWSISQQSYDTYGNPTHASSLGDDASQDDTMVTAYDSFYHLFAIEQSKGQNSLFKETGRYYGVNGLAVGDGKAYWGAMQQHCGVNEVCTLQSYDSFGRPVRQWQAITNTLIWPADGDANNLWLYIPFGTGPHSANVIAEWSNPRCEGNFVRKLYDGMGQLVQEQSPAQGWLDACGTVAGNEIAVDYAYNGLGQQVKTSVPHVIAHYSAAVGDLRRPADWSQGFTTSAYDPLGRITTTVAVDNAKTLFYYEGRKSWVIAQLSDNLSGDDRTVKWQEMDALGNLRNIRTRRNTGNSQFVDDGVVWLTHDVMGNLTCVHQAGSGVDPTNDPDCDGSFAPLPANPGNVTKLVYDLGGRKTSMSDADMGTWLYSYDRQGKLSNQRDARGMLTCLTYDLLGRLAAKYVFAGGDCQTWLTLGASPTVFFGYDHPTHSASRGQLTNIQYSDNHHRKMLAYNDQGLLTSEAVSITGATQVYTTTFGYDAYLRPITTTYPDGDIVSSSYNGLGLQASLSSSVNGLLIDNVDYNEAGMMTRMRMPSGIDLWRHQVYYPWLKTTGGTGSGNSNRRIKNILVSTSDNPDADTSTASFRLRLRNHFYNTFGDLINVLDGIDTKHFDYDSLARLTGAYKPQGNNTSQQYRYSYDVAGRITSYEATALSSSGIPGHAFFPNATPYGYDANGNVTYRNGQTLAWDSENHLASVSAAGITTENYLYDSNGQRVKKQVGNNETFYINPSFEISKSTLAPGQYITDFVWFDSAYPANTTQTYCRPSYVSGYSCGFEYTWPWVTTAPLPLTSTKVLSSTRDRTFRFMSLQATLASVNETGHHSYQPFPIDTGDILYFYAYLDPVNTPRGVRVEWYAKDVSQPDNLDAITTHAAVWGENMPGFTEFWGVPLPSYYTGTLPASATWTRFEVPAATLGLEGRKLMGVKLFLGDGNNDSQVRFARFGKRRPEPANNGPMVLQTITKYYTFNGQRVAMQKGYDFFYLHSDHLGSTNSVTDRKGVVVNNGAQRYWGYGRTRSGGPLPTDHTYTGQKQDATGLQYFNARYYDPQIGAFISPDTIVPDPTNLVDYNRYAYGRLNPLRYVDPSGHAANDAAVHDGGGGSWYGYWGWLYDNDPGRLQGEFAAWLEDHQNMDAILAFREGLDETYTQFFGSGVVQTFDNVFANLYMAYGLPDIAGDNRAAELSDGVLMGAISVGEGVGGSMSDMYASTRAGAGARPRAGARMGSGGCSFSAETVVTTVNGRQSIATIQVGTQVLAWNQATGETGYYTVTATHAHLDQTIVYLTIDQEIFVTTPEHPFFTTSGEWVGAGDLQIGTRVWQVDSELGTVRKIEIVEQPQVMYNLSVAEAHTFAVGDGQWLVHNGDCLSPNQMSRAIRSGKAPTGKVNMERVDVGKIPGEQTHVHFEDGSALNMDGTWKHLPKSGSPPTLSSGQREWLGNNGWILPAK